MAQGGGFFKGEKKKPKKGKDKAISGNFSSEQPATFSVPEVISKKKNSSW
ncbi:MAG: hypothetical protein QG600_288 [Patescibacteria group bacterium]|nr:hypothetical protein [Patescibacteria group bacterium]